MHIRKFDESLDVKLWTAEERDAVSEPPQQEARYACKSPIFLNVQLSCCYLLYASGRDEPGLSCSESNADKHICRDMIVTVTFF